MRLRMALLGCLVLTATVGGAFAEDAVPASGAPLNLALIWHQHQPLYWNRLTAEYELPWVRVHGVQEYIDSARISAEYPEIHVTFNLQPSLLWQLTDYATISAEEAALGGLYQYIGAVDNHLRWTWTLAVALETLANEDRANLHDQAFWINGYMFDNDADDPYYDARYSELNALHNQRTLTDQELLDAAALFLLWQISPELHEEYGLDVYRGHSGFNAADVIALIEAQMAILQEVVAAYREIATLGNELITSAFYHPILPLLVEHGWREDVLGQLSAGQAQHERLFGTAASGVWPPEQAVSGATVSLLGEAGFAWTTTDEGILALSLGHTPTIDELTTPYAWDGVTILFRESELSNRISFSYGNKSVEAAVADFMAELEGVFSSLEDPSQRVLTVAMDGENWMFLAGYANNGRDFLRALYQALREADWVRTVTPTELVAEGIATVELGSVPVGSWAGDLSTWSGEADEDEAWARLAAARRVVTAAGDPDDAIEAIYAAEGSDWFWWYGTDQDSNTDDLYDWLFKAHVIGAYRAAGAGEGEIPEVLSLRLELPLPVSLGEVDPILDGAATEDEDWSSVGTVSGTGIIEEIQIGYLENVLYVRVLTDGPASDLIGTDQYLIVYASGAPGEAANTVTRYSGEQLGFPMAHAAEIKLSKLRADGSGTAAVYAADGSGGWQSASELRTIALRKVRTREIMEFSLPFEEMSIEPGKSTTIAIVIESEAGIVARSSDRPVLAAIPTLIQGVEIFAVEDPAGDDTGVGTYTYPTDEVFAVSGLFDLVRYAVYDADDRWQFAYDFGALTNPWNGPQGFSHPLLYLYFDVAEGGSTVSAEEGEAAHVAFDLDHPWDVFIKIAGWPAYGRHLWTASGEGPFLVEAAADPKRGRVIVTVPKTLLPDVAGWHYVMVASQDGYGENHVRPIGEAAGIWTGGGSPDTSWAPQIYDILAPAGHTQTDILGNYVSDTSYTTLLPIEVQP